MKESKMKELMIDYLEGNLSGELKNFVARHIETNEKWKIELEQLKAVVKEIDESKALEPDPSLKLEFESFLAQEMENPQTEEHVEASEEPVETSKEAAEAKVIPMRTMPWGQIAAAAAILIIGVLLGVQYTSNQHKEEMLALSKEMEATKRLVISSLQHQSASSRIKAVNISHQLSDMDDEIVDALIQTMNTDDNTNVRLAALEALTKFVDEEKVRTALIESLAIQDKPLVQIALINLMVNLKENKAVESLQEIINDEKALDAVKEQADYGLFKLS